MKRTVLYLMIISVVLVLVSWINIGKAFEIQQPKVITSVENSNMDVRDYPADAAFFNQWYRNNPKLPSMITIPDYPEDGKFFHDMYRINNSLDNRVHVLDYTADARIFYNEYLNESSFRTNVEYPDYPLDGRFFVDHYAELP